MRISFSVLFSFFLIAVAAQNNKKDFTRYVNPFIGSASQANSLSGSVFPGACMPFGMVQLSPDNFDAPEEPASAYDYVQKTIVGFSHTHLNGTGVGDLYDIMVQPLTGTPLWQPGDAAKPRSGYRSSFSHTTEKASPGYYAVRLDDYDVNVELTATAHVGFHQYKFPKTDSAYVLFDLDHTLDKKRSYWSCKIVAAHMKQVDAYTIEGYRILTGWARLRKVYFVVKFDQPIQQGFFVNGRRVFTDAGVVNGNSSKAAFRFNSKQGSTVKMKVALSATSTSDAYKNLAAELPGWDFAATVANAKAAWNELLSVADVEGTDAKKQIFYTGLYRNFIQPNNLANADGTYSGTDFTTRKANDNTHYSTFSLWDTYRATHPLYTLLAPQKDGAFINSMLRQYDTYGYLPIWQLWGDENYCMIGNHAIPVIADAMLKGIKGFDYEKAYKACVASSRTDHPGAPFTVWNKFQYFPENLQSQSVSLTLEIAYDDWCVAQMAKKLGKTNDAAFFSSRSLFYKNLYDASTTFFRAKNDKGEWITPFNPLQYGGNGGNPFTEGNAWQYFWYVPQDVPGLIALMGGEKNFNAKLDTMFTLQAKDSDVNGNASGFIGQYAHGNEPSHHVAYLYNYSGQPWKTQYYVHKILTELYDSSVTGLSGNEDCGQMSAWYIFSAMGFYPVNPASGLYVIGSPLLKHAMLKQANGKTFSIDVTHAGKPYIQSVKLNGKPYSKGYIRHSDMEQGGTLEFVMGDEPNTRWAVGENDRPFK
ncbi:MAG TPA: glycoside hydrolase family 92 protein [Chitinophagaceae bacterium]|nr:glycoside hydrolase family 92 protein [Chitinophagaceae bacterium]